MSAVPDPALVLLEARLSPHRSLTPRQCRRVLALVGGASGLLSLPFLFMGAWPVAGFLGLDVFLLAWAFRASFRSARAYELVQVSALELRVAKVDQYGKSREWHLHPWWTRLAQEKDEDFGLQKLELVSRAARVEIATCLGPVEKQEFAGVLSEALARARAGPDYS